MFLPARFPLGTVSVSDRARARLSTVSFHHALALLLARHACGDWGNVDAAGWEKNERSIAKPKPLISVYELRIKGDVVTIIVTTNPKRTTTFVADAEDDVWGAP